MSAPARLYCEDCRHCFVPPSGKQYSRCQTPGATESKGDAYVSRDFAHQEFLYASAVRLSTVKCGPEAKWFEAKEATQQAAE